MEFSKNDTTVIKGFATILMVYHHLFAFPERLNEGISYISFGVGGVNSAYYIGVFGKVCVALFVFLSGYGIYKTCEKNSTAYIYKKRILGLYKIYWAVLIVFIPICVICNVPDFSVDLSTLVKNFVGISFSYNGEAWFLKPYIVLIFISPFLYKINSHIKTNVVIDCMVVAIINILSTWGTNEIYNQVIHVSAFVGLILGVIQTVLEILPEYLMGFICAKHSLLDKAKTVMLKKAYNNVIAGFLLIVIFTLRTCFAGKWDCVYVLGIIISVIVLLNTVYGKIIYKILYIIGEESTVIWLTHSFYCYKICQEIVFIPKLSILIVALLITMCYITSLIIKSGLKHLKVA